MSNEIREKNHEWVKAFHSNFDRLLALLEKLLEKRKPSAYGDELLRQDSLPGFRHRKDTDERVQGSVQIQKELITQASSQRTRKDFDFSGGSAVDRLPILFVFLKKTAFPNDKITACFRCRRRPLYRREREKVFGLNTL